MVLLLLILGFPLWGSILLAGASLVLCGYTIIWCVPICTGSLAIGGIVSGLVSVIGSFILLTDSFEYGILQFGAGIFMGGFGIVCAIITINL